MEIVDELMTPGCPNCALKHLSAALAALPDSHNEDCSRGAILKARAFINFVEALEGYESHWDYGVGLLVRAEEFYASHSDEEAELNTLRTQRCAAMLATTRAERRGALEAFAPASCELVNAHIAEALRELPCMTPHYVKLIVGGLKLVDVIISLIKWVKKEYFSDFETKDNEEKGGKTMATKKTAVKKAAADKCTAKKAAAGKCTAKKAAVKSTAKKIKK